MRRTTLATAALATALAAVLTACGNTDTDTPTAAATPSSTSSNTDSSSKSSTAAPAPQTTAPTLNTTPEGVFLDDEDDNARITVATGDVITYNLPADTHQAITLDPFALATPIPGVDNTGQLQVTVVLPGSHDITIINKDGMRVMTTYVTANPGRTSIPTPLVVGDEVNKKTITVTQGQGVIVLTPEPIEYLETEDAQVATPRNPVHTPTVATWGGVQSTGAGNTTVTAYSKNNTPLLTFTLKVQQR